MIISHKHKFIFLKTEKTAGTSVEIALSKYCGPDDIITPIYHADEETRRSLGYRGAQNHLAQWYEYGPRDLAKLLLKGVRKEAFYNHISAREVKRRIDPKVWDSYYKFCFERNPFDRIISHYYWCYRSEPRPTLAEFVRSGRAMSLKRRGFEVYTIDGQIAVDRICRFESLAEDLEEVRQRIGLPEPLELPLTKAKHRKDKRNYREVLGEEERHWVMRVFGDELRLLGYHF